MAGDQLVISLGDNAKHVLQVTKEQTIYNNLSRGEQKQKQK